MLQLKNEKQLLDNSFPNNVTRKSCRKNGKKKRGYTAGQKRVLFQSSNSKSQIGADLKKSN